MAEVYADGPGANWRDNPRFPAVLERQRQRDLRDRPEQYDHIWEGGFKSIVEGAYFAKALTVAKTENRIGRVAAHLLREATCSTLVARRDCQ